MLLEFSCSNHKSINNKILFSMLPTKENTYEDNIETVAGFRILRSALIYGSNGSGKSNLVDSIAFVKNLVMNSINYNLGQGIVQVPHKINGYKKESTYQVQFVKNGIRYMYGFSIKNMIIVEEYLYYTPNGRQSKIFDRKEDEYTAGSKFRGKFTSCKDVLKPNKLMLSCAANFTAITEVIEAYKFFSEDLVIYGPYYQEHWMNYSLYQIKSNPEIKQSVLAFLTALGTDIKDIKIETGRKIFNESELPPFLSDEFKNMLLQDGIDSIKAKVVYDKFETDLMADESTGIQKLFALLSPIIDIMRKGKVLVCDELESGLHEALVYGIVKLFMGNDIHRNAQMICTTHESGLLNLDFLRRDQIWFTELEKDGRSTDLYSLAEIKNVRKEDNYGKGYVSGKYGAIPMLNIDFANIVSSM